MNDPFVVSQAKIMADKFMAVPDQTTEQRIAAMVESVHGTEPTDQQIEQLQTFLGAQAKLYGKEDSRVWADLSHALLNMKAFYFLQ
jgi:osmotically-inducible protein OsmY